MKSECVQDSVTQFGADEDIAAGVYGHGKLKDQRVIMDLLVKFTLPTSTHSGKKSLCRISKGRSGDYCGTPTDAFFYKSSI